jgi:hypothetical protein
MPAGRARTAQFSPTSSPAHAGDEGEGQVLHIEEPGIEANT